MKAVIKAGVDKNQRCELINQLLKTISEQDRGLFVTKGNIARFEFRNKKLFFIDEYTKKAIYPYQVANRRHMGFSHGGTLWALINDFRLWIISGDFADGRHGYGGLYGTAWGISIDCKDKVISKAKEIGYLLTEQQTYREYCKDIVASGNEWLLGCNKEETIAEIAEGN